MTRLRDARATWPDPLSIPPAHCASHLERNADRRVGRAFGGLRRTNPTLSIESEREFARWVRARTGGFPDADRRIKGINIGLEEVSPAEAGELEAGKHRCALAGMIHEGEGAHEGKCPARARFPPCLCSWQRSNWLRPRTDRRDQRQAGVFGFMNHAR